jgi:hypothetical protein
MEVVVESDIKRRVDELMAEGIMLMVAYGGYFMIEDRVGPFITDGIGTAKDCFVNPSHVTMDDIVFNETMLDE